MNVLFRTDASTSLGAGHVMRCLTLAKALRHEGAECHFLCRTLPGHLIDFIEQQGFFTLKLPDESQSQFDEATQTLSLLTQSYQLLVVDHYGLSKKYCALLRPVAEHILVIDDLANRQHDCDVLLDQNLHPQASERYHSLVPQECELLLGPHYVLLRDEFYQMPVSREPCRVLVNFGGSDEMNLTSKAIEALSKLKIDGLHADIVIGANNPWRASLEAQLFFEPSMHLHIQCDYMAALMQKATLMLGAGGSSHWERCRTALPSIVVTVAPNQEETTAYLAKLGACVWLGKAEHIQSETLKNALGEYLTNPKRLESLARHAAILVPPHAGTPQVVNHVLKRVRGTHDPH